MSARKENMIFWWRSYVFVYFFVICETTTIVACFSETKLKLSVCQHRSVIKIPKIQLEFLELTKIYEFVFLMIKIQGMLFDHNNYFQVPVCLNYTYHSTFFFLCVLTWNERDYFWLTVIRLWKTANFNIQCANRWKMHCDS